jgi:hypothetical protein
MIKHDREAKHDVGRHENHCLRTCRSPARKRPRIISSAQVRSNLMTSARAGVDENFDSEGAYMSRFVSQDSVFHWMVLAGVEQSLTIRWASAVQSSFSGTFIPRHSAPCTGRKADLSMWTTRSRGGRRKILAPASATATCSVRSVPHGRLTVGSDGGAPI